MDIQARAKLKAWMQRPRGSLGWIMAIVIWVVAASAYQVLGSPWRVPLRDPAVLLTLLALSIAVGWAVQRGVRRTVGKAIFEGQTTGWQARLAFIRTVARESNVVLGILVLLAVLGASTLWLAGRSVERIVDRCQANLLSQAQVPEAEALATRVGRPVCTCLAQTFLDRNGVIRLAMFQTPLQPMVTFKALTPADERHCLAQFDLLPEEAASTTR